MCGTVDIELAQGQNFAVANVETPFEPKGAVACPRGAAAGYSTSTQEVAGVEQIVIFRTGSTASSVTRSVSYVVWG